ncbi:MAG: DUF4912 domain-containing protein [Firmicutes bacterium]|nr:DUF4912 domain-containing protein [Bacillota bacterium]
MVLWLIIALALAIIGYMIIAFVAGLKILPKYGIHQNAFQQRYDFELGEEWSMRKNTEKSATDKINEKLVPSTLVHELPPVYGEDKIVALVRDPYWIFAYWEITPSKQAEIERLYGPNTWEESQPVLRVYDTTGIYFNENNAHVYYDVLINNYANNWHINVGQPNRTFCVERGLILKTGQYVPLVRSNFVTTPLDHISEVVDEEWLLISEHDRKLYQRIGELPINVSSPQYAYGIEIAQELAFGISSPQMNRPIPTNQWKFTSEKPGKD